VRDEPSSTPETFAHDQDHGIPEGDQVGHDGHARTSLAEEVQAALAGLDEADPASHADAFEAVDATILAELRRLETL
jgi:hypothetical protein